MLLPLKKKFWDLLSIIIQDNGKGMPATTLDNLNKMTDIPTGMNHIGIHNIRLRLAIHYSENVADSLHFKSDEDQGTKVSLILPREEKHYDNSVINYCFQMKRCLLHTRLVVRRQAKGERLGRGSSAPTGAKPPQKITDEPRQYTTKPRHTWP